MNEAHMNEKMRAALEERKKSQERLRRRIEMGYIKGEILSNGVFIYQVGSKGIQNWYDTRTLVKLVTEAFDRNENVSGQRVCYINGKWRLQIRGKHLRRLLKAMPNVRQVGRMLVEDK